MKMNQHKDLGILGSILLLGMCLVSSCSTDGNPDMPVAGEVTFGLSGSDAWSDTEASRAAMVDKAKLAAGGFGVFAYYDETRTAPDFMNNTKVYSTDGGTTWKYAPVKYWPNNPNDDVDFYAYAPYDATFSVANTSKLTYTVPQDVAQQKDLLWSHSDTKNRTKEGGVVRFEFLHALSRIGFAAKARIEGDSPIDNTEKVVMTVKKIALTSVDDMNAGSFYSQGILNLDNPGDSPAWTSLSGGQKYELSSAHLDNEVLTLTKTGSSAPETDFQSLTTDGNYLMILPQDLSTGGGFQVYVEYEVVLWFDDKNYFSYTNGCVGQLEIDFEASKAYTIQFTLGLKESALGEVTITRWDEKEIAFDNLLNEERNGN